MRRTALMLVVLALAGCPDDPPAGTTDADATGDVAPDATDVAETDGVGDAEPDADALEPGVLTITVTLDGEPAPDVLLAQGGSPRRWRTDENGQAEVALDLAVEGDKVVLASHPEARTLGAQVFPEFPTAEATIALERYDASDNPEYTFQDPGEPGRRDTTAQCGHCHVTIDDAWHASPHRTAASNPVLQDLYAGAASGWGDQASCEAAGGQWLAGSVPGSDDTGERCYLGSGVLPALNGCAPGTDCETNATEFGGCADCHAPGIDGQLGGRDLLAARGHAYEFGVHCDVCHKVDAVDLDSPLGGVAGRLQLTRPSEEGSIVFGMWKPLTFGPSHDVPNPRMGNVQRGHYRDGRLCAGCHQLDQATAEDLDRWPSGRIPVQSTWAEWEAGPLNPAAPCQSCHMPPNPQALNSADLQLFENASVGITGGWKRQPGAVKQHSWVGPRAPDSGMLEAAAALFVDAEVVGGELVATVTTKNVGPGHALPTGEPMRHMVLVVEAACDGAPLVATGGDAVPDFGGERAVQDASGDWSVWPSAQVGDRVRVVARPGGDLDYPGVGPFGDGTFDAAAKGMPVEDVAGESEIVAVEADGTVTFDAPLPAGDMAYLVRDDVERAGAPGFGFARVLVAADGRRSVPHFEAVDVASDNRLMPQTAWTTIHRFAATCVEPAVTARLLYRPYDPGEARRRGWELVETPMVEVTR